jgi:hypothetical protein
MSRIEYTPNPPPQTLTDQSSKDLALYLQGELTQISSFIGELSTGLLQYVNSPADLNDISVFENGYLFFSFQDTTGNAPVAGSYDAVGMQISSTGQVTQLVSLGISIGPLLIRVDDGAGFSSWASIA